MAESLAAALAIVQTHLPEVRKSETAEVTMKTGGKYRYSYADLAAVSKAILPLLGAQGLSWITKPTFNADGKFVLIYKLCHGPSGQEEVGEYPLSAGGSPQEIGSAITYARRYALCSVTGVAPDDDDGQAASHQHVAEQWEQAKPKRDVPTPEQIAAKAAAAIKAAKTVDELQAHRDRVDERFKDGLLTADDHDGLVALIFARDAEIRGQSEQPADEPPAERKANQKQHARMHVLWNKAGLGADADRDQRIATTGLVINRDITSSKELTEDEAVQVIKHLVAVVDKEPK